MAITVPELLRESDKTGAEKLTSLTSSVGLISSAATPL